MAHCRLPALAPAVFASLLVFTPGVFVQQTERRTAFVVGNPSYKSTPLSNPRNDAQHIMAATTNAQVPRTDSSLTSAFCFAGGMGARHPRL
jgi:hypothetical protein